MSKSDKQSNIAQSSDNTLDSISVPSYQEIIDEIKEKIGKRPSKPTELPKGAWTEQALKVLKERYLMKNEEGVTIETPEDMVWRVAWEVASAEARWGKSRKEIVELAKEFYLLMSSREFLPNSPTLMNAGTGNGLQYSACFVLPVEDSMEGIFDALKWQALIHKTGGGTGFAFSRLRQAGATVRTSSGTASGPVSFMRIFDEATNEVKQGGKRRGANMGILRVDHPDIMEFIHCKDNNDGISNFNISVALTDTFMDAYRKGMDYDLIDPRNGNVVSKLSAEKVFNEIAESAWKSGDPGLVFIDRINASTANPVPVVGPVESTNPCGEQPLYPFDACNLGSIFLTYFVTEKDGRKEVDWEKLKKVSKIATRFLDNVIEVNPYTLPQIRQVVFAIRRIGLGIGGWADMLIELGIPYDSDAAIRLAEEVMRTIQESSLEEDQEMAKVRGAFPLFPVSIYKDDTPRRNSTVTTIAPTGSISIIAGCSSGIEPIFAIAYQHIVKDKSLDRTLTFVNPVFENQAKERGFWSDEVEKKVAEHGVIRDIEEIPSDVRKVWGTAHEIHHDWHIKMQSAFQKYTENGVSKTINMENSIEVDDIKDAYLLAWETNCKGITVFRDGCKDAQVLNLGTGKSKEKEAQIEDDEPTADIRPFLLTGTTYKLNTPVGTAFVTINHNQKGEPLEVFINVGKAGSDVQAVAEALGRTISISLRFRGNLSRIERAEEIASQLAGIGGRRSIGFGPNKILSLPDAIAAALSMHMGLRTNGYAQPAGDQVVRANGTSNGNGVSHITTAGTQLDLAGAVMSAQDPARQESPKSFGESDLTTAFAKSTLAPAGLHVSDSGSPVHVAGDICPDCGTAAFATEEGCGKCQVCGYSEC